MAASLDTPIVSVIIPCYNQGHYLDEAVNSVLAQSFRQFEIIIVNDGSTDGATNQLLTDFSRPQTRVISTENQGLAAARNNGIRAARGCYILPLDADDCIEPTYLEQAVICLDTNPEVGIVYCRARLFGAVETEWALPDFSLDAMLIDNIIFCAALFRRCDWELVGGYDESFRHGWEDYDFWLSLLERGGQVHRLADILFSYRVSPDSMVRARPRQHKLTTFRTIFHKHRQLFVDHIEVWINALLEVREPYHQAALLVSDKEGPDDGRFSRKVAAGPCRLEFDLPEPLNETLVFQPARTAVILGVHQVVLRCESGETINLDWSAKTGMARNGLLYFLDAGAPAIELLLPKTIDMPAGPARLMIELEYKAFDRECLPLAAQLLEQKKVDCMGAKLPPGNEKALTAKKQRSGKADTQYLRMLGRRWKRFFRDGSYRLVCISGLFDRQWYVQQYPDVDPSLVDPLSHYLDAGWSEGRNPHQLFENDWYRKKYMTGVDANPLLHYIESGWKLGNNPSPLFFSRYYADQCRPRLKKKQTPLAHYLVHWQEGGRPNPFYDPGFSLNAPPETLPAGIDPLTGYIRFGKSTGFNPFPLFDLAYYLESNPTVAKSWQVPLYHYLDFGAGEGSRPNRFFDPQYYRDRYLDSNTSFLDAFLHYAEQGIAQQNRPAALFDPEYYAQTYPEVSRSGQLPLVHYMRQGVLQGKYPCQEVAELKKKPVISLVTPVYNTDINLLRRCVHSVVYQIYPHWQLCLVDDGSTVQHSVYSELEKLAQQDPRIRIKRLAQNQGIAATTNAAVDLATGEYLAFLDHDDELSADALYHVVVALNEQEDADVLYSDEDLVNLESRHLDTFYKLDFNEELLLNHNYITHFLVTRRDLFLACGGLNSQYNGAQDYDLVLKLTEQGKKVMHIPRVLYHWRAHPVSTSVNHEQKQYADEAGRKAVQAALDRRGIAGVAELTDLRFFYRARRKILGKPSCSLIVDSGADGTTLLAQIKQVAGKGVNVEILISSFPELHLSEVDRLKQLASLPGETVPAWRNRAALEASGTYLCFLGCGVHPTGCDWLYALMEHAQQDLIGMVGGCLSRRFEDADAHRGSIPDLANPSWPYFASYVRDVSIHHNGIHCSQHVLAVDERLCLVRRSHFLECGQYDTAFATMAFAQLDLCFRLYDKGLKNLFTPWAAAIMEGTTGRVMSAGMEQAGHQDRLAFQQRWHPLLVAGDPYHNAQLLVDRDISPAAFLHWYAGEESTGTGQKAPVQTTECHQP